MAQDLFSTYESLRNSSTQTMNLADLNARHTFRHSHLERRVGDGTLSLSCAAPAVTCSDGVDDPGATTRDVFDFIVNLTDKRTTLCE
jgi:hypothetical protein